MSKFKEYIMLNEALEVTKSKRIQSAIEILLEEFQTDGNSSTRVRLSQYIKPDGTRTRAILVSYEVEPEEIYLDRDFYEDGEVELKLNDIFYNDLDSICKKVGIESIEWKMVDGKFVGVVSGVIESNKE